MRGGCSTVSLRGYLLWGGLLQEVLEVLCGGVTKAFRFDEIFSPVHCRGGYYFSLDRKVAKDQVSPKASCARGFCPAKRAEPGWKVLRLASPRFGLRFGKIPMPCLRSGPASFCPFTAEAGGLSGDCGLHKAGQVFTKGTRSAVRWVNEGFSVAAHWPVSFSLISAEAFLLSGDCGKHKSSLRGTKQSLCYAERTSKTSQWLDLSKWTHAARVRQLGGDIIQLTCVNLPYLNNYIISYGT